MENKNIVAIVQARMGSQRLPGKVLLPIGNKPVLAWVLSRLSHCRLINKIIVATSVNSIDDSIRKLCLDFNVTCFSGPEEDVLERFYMAAVETKADVIIRITADCPFIDPEIVDGLIATHLKNSNQYTANDTVKSYPRGVDAEVINFGTLEYLMKKAKQQYYREHVTSYIYEHPEEFKTEIVRGKQYYENGFILRLCVDEMDDLVLLKRIYDFFSPREDFNLREIVDYLAANPGLIKINENVKQKTR
ncbi:MAG: glycosyltransferase family protein [Candidatus Omnitrophica bacterium]|nr:glycosyltransferase family protein [Candidatus Omnitrophota bacterium]